MAILATPTARARVLVRVLVGAEVLKISWNCWDIK